MDAARFAPASVASCAWTLIDRLERLSVAPKRIRLPSLELELCGDEAGYSAAVERALADEDEYAGGAPLRIVFATGPVDWMPELLRDGSAETPHAVSEQLIAAGLRGAFDPTYRVWQVYDAARNLGVQLALEGRYAPWETSFPLRNFLHWHYERQGMRLVHGATLGDARGGILLGGEGGAGKSGTTLGGICNGLCSVGDDYVLLDFTEGLPVALPVVRVVKQDAEGIRRVGLDPAGLGAVGPNWQNKYEFALPEGSRLARLPLVAIVLPRLTGGPCRVTRASGREAMIGMTPSTLRQLPGGFQSGMAFMARVIRQLPAFHLELSPDPAEVTAAIRGIIEGAVA